MLSAPQIAKLFDSGSSDETLLSLLASMHDEPLSVDLIEQLVDTARAGSIMMPSTAAELEKCGARTIDCSGTGGSGQAHFNTSTTVAFVLAAAGLPVAKFGGRAASSKAGSFDFLEGLGISSALPPEAIGDAIENCGVAFILAAGIYPQLKRLAPLRKQFGRPTVLNYIGPLLNPVRPAMRLMGVSSEAVRPLIAKYLLKSGYCKNAMVVTGGQSLDELSVEDQSSISRIKDGVLAEESLSGSDIFSKRIRQLREMPEIRSTEYDLSQNLRIFDEISSGRDDQSRFYKMVVLNSSAALLVSGKVASIEEGIRCAADLISSGQVAEKVELCRGFYAKFSS